MATVGDAVDFEAARDDAACADEGSRRGDPRLRATMVSDILRRERERAAGDATLGARGEAFACWTGGARPDPRLSEEAKRRELAGGSADRPPRGLDPSAAYAALVAYVLTKAWLRTGTLSLADRDGELWGWLLIPSATLVTGLIGALCWRAFAQPSPTRRRGALVGVLVGLVAQPPAWLLTVLLGIAASPPGPAPGLLDALEVSASLSLMGWALGGWLTLPAMACAGALLSTFQRQRLRPGADSDLRGSATSSE